LDIPCWTLDIQSKQAGKVNQNNLVTKEQWKNRMSNIQQGISNDEGKNLRIAGPQPRFASRNSGVNKKSPEEAQGFSPGQPLSASVPVKFYRRKGSSLP
jgi:hypothetical protein